jgi:hypothetical protein
LLVPSFWTEEMTSPSLSSAKSTLRLLASSVAMRSSPPPEGDRGAGN